MMESKGKVIKIIKTHSLKESYKVLDFLNETYKLPNNRKFSTFSTYLEREYDDRRKNFEGYIWDDGTWTAGFDANFDASLLSEKNSIFYKWKKVCEDAVIVSFRQMKLKRILNK